MVYGLIVDNILVQKQCHPEDGFVEIPDGAICGQIWNGTALIDPSPAADAHNIKQTLQAMDQAFGPRYMRDIALASPDLDPVARGRIEAIEAEADNLRAQLSV